MGYCPGDELTEGKGDHARKMQEIKKYIDRELDNSAYDRCDCKDVARDVSTKFGIVLTPGEVKDIHRE